MKKSAFVREQVAQAVVEMAVVAPVMIVLGLIVYNLMTFLAATARFDRVAPDIVLVHGCAPSGAEELPAGEGMASTVRAQLEQAMGEYDVEIEVRESGAIEGSRNDAAPGEGRLLWWGRCVHIAAYCGIGHGLVGCPSLELIWGHPLSLFTSDR